jgi:hypothetical protein
MFAGCDEQEQEYGTHSLMGFMRGEPHTVRDLDDELIFISFLQGSDSIRPNRTGGEIRHE